MYELRILSGLHRGATLPLDNRPHVLGASDDADVVLVDPGIEPQHATLSLSETGWSLTELSGSILGAGSNDPQSLIDLAPGEFARVCNVWLTVVEQGAPWENPPPEPVDQPIDETDASDQIPLSELVSDAPLAATGDDGGVSEAMSDGSVTVTKTGKTVKSGRKVVYVSLAVATVLSAAAYAITSKPEPTRELAKLDARAHIGSSARQAHRPADKTVAAAFDAVNPDGSAQRPMTAEELRKAFRKRLAEADLLKRFDLSLQDQQWFMQAALDDDEAARFERILTAFIKTHNITFPVHAKVGSAEAMLPFKIQQVITGANASIVTQDGDRLYVGDEFKGVKLAAIQASKLTFTGKRKIEVKW
ncbi:FHA domain-containing protein [Herbaspirillum sp. GCM10030257]|uniref:FHA domain-containing protein n=1 Tax=Herbaspirillum sp. GCM10030257 TaxID=3273393 RepID=UPI00360A31C2